MANMVKTTGRWLMRLLGIGAMDEQDPSESARRTLEAMRVRLSELRECAAAAAAAQYRIEQSLQSERQRLETLQDPDHRARCQASIAETEQRLVEAAKQTEQAQQSILLFREELRATGERMKGAQLQSRLAAIRAQAEKLAMESRFEEGMAAIDRMESKASQASAEARALAELNEALRGECPDAKRGDDDERE